MLRILILDGIKTISDSNNFVEAVKYIEKARV